MRDIYKNKIEYFSFKLANINDMFSKKYYKNFIDVNTGGLRFKFSCESLTITDPKFYIFDERDQRIRIDLFDVNYSFSNIPLREAYETGSEWYVRNINEIQEWEENPIDSLNSTIYYIDINKKTCKMSSGYIGKIENYPSFAYPFDSVVTTTIFTLESIKELGYSKQIQTPIMEIPIIDLRSHKNFDYICVNYIGLVALARDLQLKIVPKYPFMLLLKKEM